MVLVRFSNEDGVKQAGGGLVVPGTLGSEGFTPTLNPRTGSNLDSLVLFYEAHTGRGDYSKDGLVANPSTSRDQHGTPIYIRMLIQDIIAHEFGHATDIATGQANYYQKNPRNEETKMLETQAIEWENRAAQDRAVQGSKPRPLRDPTIHKSVFPSFSDYIEPQSD